MPSRSRTPKSPAKDTPVQTPELIESDGQIYEVIQDLGQGRVLAIKAGSTHPAAVYVVARALAITVEDKPVAPSPARSAPSGIISIWTDGSCLGNPGPGGWGYVRRDANGELEASGGAPNTTNNRMEMMAAIEALKSLPATKQRVELHSDSQLIIKTMTEGWKRNANRDLWEELDRLAAQHQVTWRWVRGHNGHPENERCDTLAQSAAEAQSRRGR